jgi:Domain of unknown function (DUF4375)
MRGIPTGALLCGGMLLLGACKKTEEGGPPPVSVAVQEPAVQTEAIEASLDAFNQRKRYSTITPEVLATIPDHLLEQALIDHLIDVRIRDRVDDEYAIVAGLSAGYRTVYATWLLETEVNNGGFHQFFSNSSGQFAIDALAGCRLIGADQHADLLKQAIATNEKERSEREKDGREAAAESFSRSSDTTALEELDRQFFDLDDLSPERIRYVRDHPDEFRSP